jgi:hypothetical protein
MNHDKLNLGEDISYRFCSYEFIIMERDDEFEQITASIQLLQRDSLVS